MSSQSNTPLTEPSHIFFAPNHTTRQPPTVHPTTHILGICGVCDAEPENGTNIVNPTTNNLASPRIDGWLLSDFYLWMHILSGMGKSQTWLTCEDASELLTKYCRRVDTGGQGSEGLLNVDGHAEGEEEKEEAYLHGDPFEPRRVVLDHTTLPLLQPRLTTLAKGVTARSQFLATLRNTLQRASTANEPVLLLIFARGNLDPYMPGGFALGLAGEAELADLDKYLTFAMFAAVVKEFPDVEVGLYMSSCVTGHWVYYPRLNLRKDGGVGAAEYAAEYTHTLRHCGGHWIAAARQELEGEDGGGIYVRDEKLARTRLRRLHSMLAAVRCVPDISRYPAGSSPLFDEEMNDDDDCNDEEKRRSTSNSSTAYTIADYLANYNNLRILPPYNPHNLHHQLLLVTPTQRPIEHQLGKVGSTFTHYGSTHRGLLTSGKYMARLYRSTLTPSAIERQKDNKYHAELRRYLNGHSTNKGWDTVCDFVRFRVAHIVKANWIVAELGLAPVFPRMESRAYSRNRGGHLFGLVLGCKVFAYPTVERPIQRCGAMFMKPERYLAAAFAEAWAGVPGVRWAGVRGEGVRWAGIRQEEGVVWEGM